MNGNKETVVVEQRSLASVVVVASAAGTVVAVGRGVGWGGGSGWRLFAPLLEEAGPMAATVGAPQVAPARAVEAAVASSVVAASSAPDARSSGNKNQRRTSEKKIEKKILLLTTQILLLSTIFASSQRGALNNELRLYPLNLEQVMLFREDRNVKKMFSEHF